MRISITIITFILCIYIHGAYSKSVKTYYGNAIRDTKGFRKPFASPLGNSINENYIRSKRETTKGMKEFQDLLDKAKFECVEELQMDTKLMEKSLMLTENPTKKEKCLMACMLKKTKIMENNLLSLKTIDHVAGMISQNNPLVISIAVATANNCNAMIKATEPCETAYQINKCISNELKAHKLKLHY